MVLFMYIMTICFFLYFYACCRERILKKYGKGVGNSPLQNCTVHHAFGVQDFSCYIRAKLNGFKNLYMKK